MERAARELHVSGPRSSSSRVATGEATKAVDVAFDGRAVTLLRAPWVDTPNVHGTGCTFSAAIAANMALGLEPLEAACHGQGFVTRAIQRSSRWRLGAGHGPLDQLGRPCRLGSLMADLTSTPSRHGSEALRAPRKGGAPRGSATLPSSS